MNRLSLSCEIFSAQALKTTAIWLTAFLPEFSVSPKKVFFSGLNNLVVNSVLDRKYSEYFGFTRDEITEMAAYYHASDKIREICNWYDGYRFGNTEIF